MTSPETKDWWTVTLMPAGVFEKIDAFALQYITGLIYITTNDIVLVHEGMPHVFEHARCEPAGPEWWNFTTHVLRPSYESMKSHDQHRRLVTVPTYEAPHLPLWLEDYEVLTRPYEPAEPTGRRVDLAPVLLPELARVLRAGDPDGLSAVLALLDLLARFDATAAARSTSPRRRRGARATSASASALPASTCSATGWTRPRVRASPMRSPPASPPTVPACRRSSTRASR
ncbi:hypothetical protein OV090_09125 [Nannocystis sp. RBIL2]|uniref:hypothetical protein n=1 Tax=Nannocystis sp. RBIL2 TaxID=2996788 RepID=UPI00226DEA54|nr:hypothetical protein [Nannocystis sp. RBIL2]MCY1064920.1 hypothetical protein [Nannocystis sp. RBIL2]